MLLALNKQIEIPLICIEIIIGKEIEKQVKFDYVNVGVEYSMGRI